MFPLLFGFPGITETLLILAVLLLLAKAMGSSINQFKKGLHEDPDELPENSMESSADQEKAAE